VRTRTPLQTNKVWTDPPSPASVSVSSDGGVLALGTDQGPDLSTWWFEIGRGPLRGHLKFELPPSAYATKVSGCPASWTDDSMELPGSGYPDTIRRGVLNGPRIVADPRLAISCSVWASEALSGTAYQDLSARVFDDSGRVRLGTTSWLSWHWRETLVLGVVGLALVAGVVVRRRRRRETGLRASHGRG
jgi:hypothetical protein